MLLIGQCYRNITSRGAARLFSRPVRSNFAELLITFVVLVGASDYNMICFVDVWSSAVFLKRIFDELAQNVLFGHETKSDCCSSISSHQASSPSATGVHGFAHCLWKTKMFHLPILQSEMICLRIVICLQNRLYVANCQPSSVF